MENFSKRLVFARKNCGMTQAEVAEKLDVSYQAVSLWERGETYPDICKLPDIAGLFQVTTDWLLSGIIEKPIKWKSPPTERLFDEERMYTYVKTYATTSGLHQTLKVLPYAREKHKGQFRKGNGEIPYIYHPLMLACHALSLGLVDDNLISAALLHDVCEDCGVLPEELPVNEETRQAVVLLTKTEEMTYEKYYGDIAENEIATMVKLLDRCNNISGMAAAFPKEKMIKYINVTHRWFEPLIEHAKKAYPMYGNQIFLIKYHMFSVIESLKHQL